MLAEALHLTKKTVYIVAYLLKAGTVEPEKQPLLANSSEITFVSGQRSRTSRFPWQQSARNSGGTVGNGVFYRGSCRGVIRRTTGGSKECVSVGAM
jgi:hypothetical protein